MADSKITALTALTAADPVNDMFPVVDVSDTSMAASGTTKRISANNILSSSPTASGALTVTGLVTAGSATITGDLTVDTSTLKVDSTNNRVGIGTATPAVTLDVVGAARFVAAATGPKLSIENAGGSTRFKSTDTSSFYYSAYDHNFTNTDGSVNRYYIDQNGVSTWYVSGTTAMTLNSTGLGIGGSPSYKLDVVGPVMRLINSAATADIFITDSGTTNGNVRLRGESNALKFITGGGVSATLDANGYLLVGKTSVSPSNAGCELQTGTGGNAASVFVADGAFASIMNRLTSDGTIIDFRRQTSSVGYIAVTTLATTYNSISDYRLKEAVQPLVGGLARVSALKPSIYKWKVNGSDGEGFLAHELAEVVPSAVTGEKDAVNEDGSIKAQGVDMSRIVPILVAAIQELTARVQTLEAK